MKILLTGGGGFLGGNILRETPPSIEVVSVDVREHSSPNECHSCVALDLTDSEALRGVLTQSGPDVVIHTAAVSDIDYCEAHPDVARAVNVGITADIAAYCSATDTKMIHFSSDSVFDGERGGYAEDDAPAPLHFYGRTKVEGEHIVRGGPQRWNIVRPALIVGLPVSDFGNSFLWRMIKDVREGTAVAFPAEEIRSPVDAVTLSRAVLELAVSGLTGVFHLGGNTRLSRFDMARRICRFLGFSEDLVVPKRPAVATGRAPRPVDVSLNNAKATRELRTPMLSLEEGLLLIRENKGSISL